MSHKGAICWRWCASSGEIMTRELLILVTAFLDALGYGLIVPVLPEVVRRFYSDPGAVSHLYGYFVAAYAVVQFVAAPVLGALSDRYGRRPVLLVSLAGAAIDYLMMAFAPTFALLFVGRVISGLTGASMAVASTYVADISDDSNRSIRFGRLGAAIGLGIVIGPGVGGLLAHVGTAGPFVAAAALNFVNFAAAVCLLPESLRPGLRRPVDISRCNPLSSLGRLRRATAVRRLLWCHALVLLAARATSSLWALYTGQRFGWSAASIGASLAFIGLIGACAQGTLPRVLVARLGERRALTVGILVSVATYVAIGLATRGWMLYLIVAVTALAAVTVPLLQSMMARQVSADSQGELQGTLAALTSLTAIAGPLLYTNVFAHVTKSQFAVVQGSPFLLAAVFCLVAWLLAASPQHRVPAAKTKQGQAA